MVNVDHPIISYSRTDVCSYVFLFPNLSTYVSKLEQLTHDQHYRGQWHTIKFHNGAHDFIHEVFSLKNLYYTYYIYIVRFMVAIVGYIALTFTINVSINADTSWIRGRFLGLLLKHCSTVSLSAAALLVILSRYF